MFLMIWKYILFQLSHTSSLFFLYHSLSSIISYMVSKVIYGFFYFNCQYYNLHCKYRITCFSPHILATPIHSLNLASFMEPSIASSSSTVASSLSPACNQQDEVIVTWLLSSITPSLLTKMVGLKNSYQIWHNLMVYYSSQTRDRVQKT